ncbi:putative Telomere-associated protein RIF1 [Melia azedarach]|uniref:Telomere-associated protein RIF1 n=1 Tax=Melia azedarach TaxID=155640 RepID=A0ACC1XCW6_MELAZ|nr:putative Telomere-associated protein RIF1 [Melia azedarach]
MMKLVLDPILEAVFQIGPYGKNSLSCNLCLKLLDGFILAKCKDMNCNTTGFHHLSASTSMLGPSTSGRCSWKQHPITWLPWDLSQLDFFMSMINIIASHVSTGKVSYEERNLACDAALRVFRSVFKGANKEFKNVSIDFNDIMLCLNSILKFTRNLFEDIYSEGSGSNYMHHAPLLFVEAVSEELEPSILGSSLYMVALDLKYVENLLSSNNTGYEKVLGFYSVTYMDMISPVSHLAELAARLMKLSRMKIREEPPAYPMPSRKSPVLCFNDFQILRYQMKPSRISFNYYGLKS